MSSATPATELPETELIGASWRSGLPELQSGSSSSSNAAELFHERTFAVQELLGAVSHRHFDEPDIPSQQLEARGAERSSLVAAVHRSVKRDVALYHGGTEGHSGHTGRQAGLVPRVADRDTLESLPQRAHGFQVQLVVLCGIGADRVQDNQILEAEDVDGMLDLLDAAHAS